MISFLGVFRRAIALFLAFYFVLVTFSLKPASIEPLDRENLQLDLALISDVHTEGNNQTRFDVNSACFKNLEGGREEIDALVLLGDLTMNGKEGEYLFFYGMMERVNPIRPYYPIIGNHDVGNSTEVDFSDYQSRALGYLRTFVDKDINALYYSEVVKGYHLIFLAPDAAESTSRHLSEAQLDWLEAELDAAAESGLSIFVFNHYPYNRMDDTCEDRYVELLNKYDNTFVIVGHMHHYMRTAVIPGEKKTPEIWVPCVSMLNGNNEPYSSTGRGYFMEVYPDTVEFRAFNFYTDEFFDWSAAFPLKGAASEPEEPPIGPAIGW